MPIVIQDAISQQYYCAPGTTGFDIGEAEQELNGNHYWSNELDFAEDFCSVTIALIETRVKDLTEGGTRVPTVVVID